MKRLDNDKERLRDNNSLQEAVIHIAKSGNFTHEDWRLIIMLSWLKEFTKDNWNKIKNNKNLQKAIVVAQQSGIDFNTNLDLLQQNIELRETLAHNYDMVQEINIQNNSQGHTFKKACQTLQHQLAKDVITNVYKANQKGKIFDLEKEYAYQQIKNQNDMLSVVNNCQKNPIEKINALSLYESNAKKKSSGWIKFAKAITGVISTGVGAILGAAAGVGIGILAGGSSGSAVPGLGTLAGSIVGAAIAGWKGATIGATLGATTFATSSYLFFNRDSKEEKLIKKVATSGKISVSTLQSDEKIKQIKLDSFKKILLGRLGNIHAKYEEIAKSTSFRSILKVACKKRKKHYFSKESGVTKTMYLIKEILDQNRYSYKNFRDCCVSDDGKIRFSAMRYFAFYGFLNKSAETEVPSFENMSDYSYKDKRQKEMLEHFYAIDRSKTRAKDIIFNPDDDTKSQNKQNDNQCSFY